MSREIIISTVSFHLPSRKETLESNLERAHEYVKEAIKRKSDICCLPEIFTVFGVEDYTNALKDYDKAIEVDPENPRWYNNRADFYDEQERYDGQNW